MKEKSDLAASVAARLLNRAKQFGDEYQTVLTSYCLERFLYRLGASTLRDRFVLKGAMLLRLWSEQPYRATRDLDLLRQGEGSSDTIHDDLRTILSVPVPPDAVEFDGESIGIEPIRAEDEYAGTRATVRARCGNARLSLQIDVGIADSVWPAPESRSYPTLLDSPSPEILAYPREAVVAEKLEAMVVLGDRSSRIKDFFDLQYLASHFEYDRATVTEAVRRTFARRRTPVPEERPIGLTREYWDNPSRPAQLRAFARRARIEMPEGFADECARLLEGFLCPVLEDVGTGKSSAATWPPGGPWQ